MWTKIKDSVYNHNKSSEILKTSIYSWNINQIFPPKYWQWIFFELWINSLKIKPKITVQFKFFDPKKRKKKLHGAWLVFLSLSAEMNPLWLNSESVVYSCAEMNQKRGI